MKFTEAKKKKSDDDTTRKSTTTKTTSGVDVGNLDDLLNKQDKPLDKSKEPKKVKDEPAIELPSASQSDTLRATSNIRPNERMADLMSRMRDIEAEPDDPGYPMPDMDVDADTTVGVEPVLPKPPGTELSVEVNTENLPAIANKELLKAGKVKPDWHQVANLPGNIRTGIRTMGRQLFRMLTKTPTDEINMIGNVMGMGPNSSREINAVSGYLRDKGEDLGLGDIDFNDIIPGYNAEIYQYRANGIRWLLVRDEFGQYIYVWPEKDSVQHSSKPELEKPRPKRLGRN
jgi:hypothetical protein